jgi:hypothetical protein
MFGTPLAGSLREPGSLQDFTEVWQGLQSIMALRPGHTSNDGLAASLLAGASSVVAPAAVGSVLGAGA